MISIKSVALFFCVNGKLLLHSVPLEKAEPYGDFLNYPYSHDLVWEKCHRSTFPVDFDYYPRGRVIYNRAEDSFIIYHDRCITEQARALQQRYGDRAVLRLDEHYQCHRCNADYHSV